MIITHGYWYTAITAFTLPEAFYQTSGPFHENLEPCLGLMMLGNKARFTVVLKYKKSTGSSVSKIWCYSALFPCIGIKGPHSETVHKSSRISKSYCVGFLRRNNFLLLMLTSFFVEKISLWLDADSEFWKTEQKENNVEEIQAVVFKTFNLPFENFKRISEHSSLQSLMFLRSKWKIQFISNFGKNTTDRALYKRKGQRTHCKQKSSWHGQSIINNPSQDTQRQRSTGWFWSLFTAVCRLKLVQTDRSVKYEKAATYTHSACVVCL